MQFLDFTFRYLTSTLCLLLLFAGAAGAVTLGISKDGKYFTLNGKPTYLNGISYYAGTSVDDPKDLKLDLDDMVKYRFNWIRVWTHWDAFGVQCATTFDGKILEPAMSRLKMIVAECDKRGMIVDVTMHRGKHPPPSNREEHLACARTLAKELKQYRNVYIDVGNERDVGDARHVPMKEVGELITEIKKIDPKRICTASGTPDSQAGIEQYLNIGKVDFIAPHLCRENGCAAKTLGTVAAGIEFMKAIGRRVPIHLQEPFRRGYQDYQPSAIDFYRDSSGGKLGGAAGWCLHNGSTRGDHEKMRYRSFGMGKERGRLFAQLDEVELQACKGLDEAIGGTDVNVLRYHPAFEEQIQHEVGKAEGASLAISSLRAKAGYLATGRRADLPAGKHTLTWRLRTDGTVEKDTEVVVIDVRAGDKELAKKTILLKEFKGSDCQSFELPFTTKAAGPIEFRAYWPGKCGFNLDHITLRVGGKGK